MKIKLIFCQVMPDVAFNFLQATPTIRADRHSEFNFCGLTYSARENARVHYENL